MSSSLSDAVDCLKRGQVIITPSESCYGFSCDAQSSDAVQRIQAIKQSNQPFTLLVSDIVQVEQFGVLNDVAQTLSSHFHPGQLNLIIDLKDPEHYHYLSQSGIAFRIPKHPILLDLIKQFGGPITTTSANVHGQPAIYSVEEVRRQFSTQVCTVIDDGELDQTTLVSTVYDTRTNIIVRQGPISQAQIQRALHSS